MNNISLSQNEKEVLLGGLLGDSSCKRKDGVMKFWHSQKQREYLLWKYDFFNKDRRTNIYDYERIMNDKKYYSSSFEYRCKDQEFMNFIKYHLYSNTGRKKISMKYLKELSPLSLAIWWLDDGSLSVHKGNRWGKLCTHCFNYEENILIQKYFKKQWGIDVDIRIEKQKYYFIRLNVKALRKLFSIIYKYVCEVPSMIYKIDLNYKNNVKLGDYEQVYNYIKNHIIEEL